MNETTQFLAQLMGPITFIVALSAGLKTREYMAWFKQIDQEEPYVFLQGMIELTVGLAVVLNHNLWDSLPQAIISIFGWAMIVEGTLMLLISKLSLRRALLKATTPALMRLAVIIGLAAGAYLTWAGYML